MGSAAGKVEKPTVTEQTTPAPDTTTAAAPATSPAATPQPAAAADIKKLSGSSNTSESAVKSKQPTEFVGNAGLDIQVCTRGRIF